MSKRLGFIGAGMLGLSALASGCAPQGLSGDGNEVEICKNKDVFDLSSLTDLIERDIRIRLGLQTAPFYDVSMSGYDFSCNKDSEGFECKSRVVNQHGREMHFFKLGLNENDDISWISRGLEQKQTTKSMIFKKDGTIDVQGEILRPTQHVIGLLQI